jgi:hypothetical protein
LAFFFFPGNEQYQQTTQELFPGSNPGEVTSRRGKHLFYTYVLTPPGSPGDSEIKFRFGST